MKKRNFSGLVRAKPIRFSESHFDFVVQAFNHSTGNRFLRSEVVEQNFPVLGEAGRYRLEGLEPRASDPLAPPVQKLSGPSRRAITPEVFKGRDQPISTDGSQARMGQLAHALAFADRPVLPIFEQGPEEVLQARQQAGLGQWAGFVTADFIDRLVELLADVEAVQDMQRGQSHLDRRQIRRPHVRTDIADAPTDRLAQAVESRQERLLSAIMTDPKQAG